MPLLQEWITVDELAKLTMPLLIMHGDLDAVTSCHGAKVGFFSKISFTRIHSLKLPKVHIGYYF